MATLSDSSGVTTLSMEAEMDLSTMRANVRRDLKDTDASAYRWTDEELDGHIGRAVAEYGEVCPLVATVEKTAGPSSTYDLSSEPGYRWCLGAEYPLDEAPRSLVGMEETSPGLVVLLLDEGSRPTSGESVRFYYAKNHTLSSASTLPPEHEGTVARGAAAYALAAMARYAVDRIAASGHSAAEWRALAEAELASFRAELERWQHQAAGAVSTWGAVPEGWETV